MSWSKISVQGCKTVAILLLAVSLAACGFQLRGRANLPFETLYVEGGSPAFLADLKRAININSGTRLLPSSAGAQAILQISGENREKRILSLSGAGRVREYLLVYRMEFRLHDGRGLDLLPRQTLELRRDMTYDDTLVLAKESEELLLYQDMQKDVISQILRRMNAAKLPPPIAPEK